MQIAPAIALSSDQQAALEQWARSLSLRAQVFERARSVLLAAAGQQDKQIANAMKITPQKVSRWRSRFLTLGIAGLRRDSSRPGRTFLSRPHSEPTAARCISRSRRTRPGDRQLHRPRQRKSQTLHLHGPRFRDLGEGQTCLPCPA